MRFSAGKAVRTTRLAVTPMIDVVFLLLVFFMVGMKFRQQDRQITNNLAGGDGPPRMWDIQISIRNQGTEAAPKPRIAIDQAVMRDWGDARARLARLAQLPDGTKDPVIIDAADDALHDWVMSTIDILKQLGFRNIGFRR